MPFADQLDGKPQSDPAAQLSLPPAVTVTPDSRTVPSPFPPTPRPSPPDCPGRAGGTSTGRLSTGTTGSPRASASSATTSMAAALISVSTIVDPRHLRPLEIGLQRRPVGQIAPRTAPPCTPSAPPGTPRSIASCAAGAVEKKATLLPRDVFQPDGA